MLPSKHFFLHVSVGCQKDVEIIVAAAVKHNVAIIPYGAFLLHFICVALEPHSGRSHTCDVDM